MAKNILKITKLTKKLWKNKVLDWVDMNIEIWSIYWLLWPNGAWKTTILKVISWIIKKDNWDIIFNKNKFTLESLNDIGVLIDHPILYENNSWIDNLKIHALLSNKNYKKFDEILDLVWLKKEARKNKVKTYSLWMKQRLAIAIALVWEPKLLILDEPLNWIDIEWVIEFRDILKNLQSKWITIIISSHILNEIQKTCSHIWIFNKWKMKFEWTMEELLKLWNDVEQSYLNFIKQ